MNRSELDPPSETFLPGEDDFSTYMYGVLFDFPTATDTINQIGAYSSPWFSELWPYAAIIGGISLAVGIIYLIISRLSPFGHH